MLLRAAGVVLALFVTADQSYDPTQVFGTALATIVGLSLIPVSARTLLGGLGAGVLFFGGALLWAQAAGVAMLALGAIAGVASAIDALHQRRDVTATVVVFFAALALVVAATVTIILTVEG
jgi:hypothetical protein